MDTLATACVERPFPEVLCPMASLAVASLEAIQSPSHFISPVARFVAITGVILGPQKQNHVIHSLITIQQ